MKSAVAGMVIGAGWVWLSLHLAAPSQEAYGQRPAVSHAAPAHPGLVALATNTGDDRQQVTIIDPQSRVISVYHIEPRSGEIVLKSVRNITWDLQMVEFNSSKPVPQEIRALLERR
jgi:hypothetical protein